MKLIYCLAVAGLLSACGGGGSSSPSTGSTPPTSPPPSSGGGNTGATDLKGIAPISDLSGILTVGGNTQSFSINVRAFDEESNEPVALSSLNTISGRSTSAGGEVTTFTVSQARPPSCQASIANQSSEAMMLFDRSGSIQNNDPNGDILEAGIAFSDLLGAPDTAAVAAFTTVVSNDIEYLTGGFTSDRNAISTAIRAIRSPDGGTPLWSSMVKAIESGGFPNSAQNKALITFSDGENTESGSSRLVLEAARDNNVKLYSVSVNNRNSGELDRLSFATDGMAWSTDDAARVASFSRSLSKVLDGDFTDCSVGINVEATAENYEQADLILGPGQFIKPGLTFDYSLNGDSGEADNAIIFPFAAGRKIGSTNSTNFGNADTRSGASNSCVVQAQQCSTFGGVRFVNNCTAPVTAHICSDDGACQTKLLPAATNEPRLGVIFSNVDGAYTKALCASSDIANFQPVSLSGTSPNLTASLPEFEENFTCLYTERMPAQDRPDEFFQTDRNCRVN